MFSTFGGAYLTLKLNKMKKGNTEWILFLHGREPDEQELKECAETMINGKGYLFIDEDGKFVMKHKKKASPFTNEVFLKTIRQ